ncbi:uncharacterized protein LOC122084596 isoform X2 [Macadamia integrifolia]|uniref:uncharacterized protein LOC122084596 isoform X2 n=1 Tax=Macadamia integrifolia TaxID=60698 RepID=UPI001C4FEB1E|nr:uncharacterized protein LOC122084596 isoform X2 [Macadamia integrifolia]XP_042508909.1 uncharacterized protein LOC122084596 isoform X2 [Macadamia integrifolia]
MEEANFCGFNHLDADVRLPPRKRLLAGLKKQSCNYSSPSSPLSSIATDYTAHLRNLLSSDSKSLGLSADEIVDASRSAAIAAAKVAAAAKAAAEEKAAVAVRAAAAAKTALELVASVSERASCKERSIRKSKPKKHVPVKLLYKKRQTVENCKADEELAYRLHRAMNSSPRISKNPDSSARKIDGNDNHKKLPELDKTMVSDGVLLSEGNPAFICEKNAVASEVNCRGVILKVGNTDKVGERGFESKSLDCTKANCLEMDRFPSAREAVTSYPKKKYGHISEDNGTTGRKRGRIKQKKLSLTLCTIKDRENLREDTESIGCSLMAEPNDESVSRNMRLVSVNTPSEENKIMQPLCSNPTVTTGSAMIEVDQ